MRETDICGYVLRGDATHRETRSAQLGLVVTVRWTVRVVYKNVGPRGWTAGRSEAPCAARLHDARGADAAGGVPHGRHAQPAHARFVDRARTRRHALPRSSGYTPLAEWVHDRTRSVWPEAEMTGGAAVRDAGHASGALAHKIA